MDKNVVHHRDIAAAGILALGSADEMIVFSIGMGDGSEAVRYVCKLVRAVLGNVPFETTPNPVKLGKAASAFHGQAGKNMLNL